MGVSYRPVLYLGKHFEDQREAQSFYEQYSELSAEDEEYIDNNDFQEFLYDHKELSGIILNRYSGHGFVLGINLSYPGPLEFKNEYDKAIITWKKYFKDEPFDSIHEVVVS